MNINIKQLKEYNLTPNQYVLIYLAYNKRYSEFNKLFELLESNEFNHGLNKAEEEGFVKVGQNLPEDLEIRNKFLFMIGKEGNDEENFDELVNEYPVKVIRPDGTKDYLRTDLSRCRKNYKKYVTSKRKHDRIMKALRYEKKVREKEGSWKYMKKLPKWLVSEEWRVFEERMSDEKAEANDKNLGYGQQLK